MTVVVGRPLDGTLLEITVSSPPMLLHIESHDKICTFAWQQKVIEELLAQGYTAIWVHDELLISCKGRSISPVRKLCTPRIS